MLENEGTFRDKGIIKGHEKTFEGDRHVYHINCGNDLPVYLYVKIYQVVHFKYVQFTTCHIMLSFFFSNVGIRNRVIWIFQVNGYVHSPGLPYQKQKLTSHSSKGVERVGFFQVVSPWLVDCLI